MEGVLYGSGKAGTSFMGDSTFMGRRTPPDVAGKDLIYGDIEPES